MLFIAKNNAEASPSGSAVKKEYTPSMMVVNYLPVIVFLGVLILALFYCERWT